MTYSFCQFLFALPHREKLCILIILDVLLLLCSCFLAYWFRLDDGFSIALYGGYRWWLALGATVFSSLTAAVWLGLYRTIVRYISLRTLLYIFILSVLSGFFLYLYSRILSIAIPRSIPIIYIAFATFLCAGIRFVASYFFIRIQKSGNKAALIYGAGDGGRQLYAALQSEGKYNIVAFIDDDKKLWGKIIRGMKVYSPQSLSDLIWGYDIKTILLAMPRTPQAQKRIILERLEELGLEILSVPSISDIVSRKAHIDQLRPVDVEELLGRDPIPPVESLLYKNTQGKAVLVTGAGGSIGSELCRQILLHRPSCLVLFELNELALYTVMQHLRVQAESQNINVVPILGNVQDEKQLEEIFRTFHIDTVYHAAAYKHVPIVEYNTVQGIRNNVFGTVRAARAALAAGVSLFVLISTDKAVRPTNIMGTTKRMAELVLQAFAATQDKTIFSMVRFGNVLGSSGSVIPLFREQIAKGGPITITHPDIIRYFMTIPEAVQLVIQAGAMGKGGDVFILDMGEPVIILDMAKRLIRLSGRSIRDERHPSGDIEIALIGLRPGEKLFEELLIEGKAIPTEHPRIMRKEESCMAMDELKGLLGKLERACDRGDIDAVFALLQRPATSFTPRTGIKDILWNEQGNNGEEHLRIAF